MTGMEPDQGEKQMATDREIALHQALVAFIAETSKAGLDVNDVVSKANAGLIGNSIYRIVDHPYVGMSIKELEEARDNVVAISA